MRTGRQRRIRAALHQDPGSQRRSQRLAPNQTNTHCRPPPPPPPRKLPGPPIMLPQPHRCHFQDPPAFPPHTPAPSGRGWGTVAARGSSWVLCVLSAGAVCERETERERACVYPNVFFPTGGLDAGGLFWVLCVLGARAVCERDTERARV